MKELSIEQKAQRYDNAIEIAKSLYDYSQPISASNVIINNIFPELRESEDERIRKDIIVLIKDWWDRVNKDNISTKGQMLAWLEKQGSEPNWCHHKVDLSNCSEEYRKACDWLEQTLSAYIPYCNIDIDLAIENFRKYMKGE